MRTDPPVRVAMLVFIWRPLQERQTPDAASPNPSAATLPQHQGVANPEPGHLVHDDRTVPSAPQDRAEAARFMYRIDDYRNVVFPRKCNRSGIHDGEALH